MHRIAVVGEKDSVYGFATLGLEVFPVENASQAKTVVKRLVHENVAIIYLTESVISEIYDELTAFTAESLVSIVPIPGVTSDAKLGMESLRKAVIKAVGTDILFSKS